MEKHDSAFFGSIPRFPVLTGGSLSPLTKAMIIVLIVVAIVLVIMCITSGFNVSKKSDNDA